MDRSLFLELIRQTRKTLDSIKKFTQLSRGKFRDQEFGDFYYRAVTRDIEKNDLLLESFLNYVKAAIPTRKRGTINRFLTEELKKHQALLEEKKAKILKGFEADLPETTVPDEPLRFILDSILQYAATAIPPGGSIELLTKSAVLQKEMREGQPFIKENGKVVEVLVSFTDKEPKEEAASPKEGVPDLILRLVEDMVERNRGIIRFEFDGIKAKRLVSLKLPVERREVVRYG
ncbi:MAG: hypothetical protein ACE144_08060 [Thermodesulfobacteriota bacterium]